MYTLINNDINIYKYDITLINQATISACSCDVYKIIICVFFISNEYLHIVYIICL